MGPSKGGQMRRAVGDALMSAGVLAVLLIALVSTDVRLREQVTLAIDSMPESGLSGVQGQLQEIGSVIVSAVRYHSIEHASLMIFVVAATVLVVCMVRT